MANLLDKYGVPIPGSGNRAPMKQPKPKWRFRVLFFGFGGTEDGNMIALDTNTAGSPHVQADKVAVNSYNSTAYYKGRPTWNEIEIAFRDSVGNDSLKAVWNQLRKEFNFYTQESRTTAAQYKFEMWIQALDGSNADNLTNLYEGTLHTWVCQGCLITDSNFGDFDYSSSEAQVISMTIQPDACVLLGPEGQALGDEVSGFGSPENVGAITNSQNAISSDTLPDSNFYEGQ